MNEQDFDQLMKRLDRIERQNIRIGRKVDSIMVIVSIILILMMQGAVGPRRVLFIGMIFLLGVVISLRLGRNAEKNGEKIIKKKSEFISK